MGASGSKLEKVLGESLPESEKFFGLENTCNTCYCNSVLQALYFCRPFREQMLQYAASHSGKEENLLVSLAELFATINSQKKKTGVVAPKRFVQTLKNENEIFRSFMHQDAHEFLNYLLNEIGDILAKEAVAKDPALKGGDISKVKTWVHDIFEGQLTNETRCLCCETVTSRDEAFIDLSLEIDQNTSVTSCLRNFSSIETLKGEDKFFCDTCCSLQEAQKRMKLKRPPKVLALHLKRFKFIEQLGRYKKLCYRVVFPHELKLCNTVDGCDDEDSAYNLFAVVVHVGVGVNHGHYVCMVKSYDHWISFDDEIVEPIEESQLQTFFGSTTEHSSDTDHGYILFYAKGPLEEDVDLAKAGQVVKEHMDNAKRP